MPRSRKMRLRFLSSSTNYGKSFETEKRRGQLRRRNSQRRHHKLPLNYGN